jgi:AhpD family alkylhydroperoxidase
MTDPEMSPSRKVADLLMRKIQSRDRLKKDAPELLEGFSQLVKHCHGGEALDRKQKELMAIAASVATVCIPCLANHARNAFLAGASRQEIFEAAAVGVEFGGAPSFVAVRDNLPDFMDEIEASSKND